MDTNAETTPIPSRRRWLVTLLGPLAVLLGEVLIPLPGIDHGIFNTFHRADGGFAFYRPVMSVFALGIVPYVTASVLVEILALLVPRWRRLRTGTEGRRRLLQAALSATILLAAVQGHFVAAWLESTHQTYAHLGTVVPEPGVWFRLTIQLSLVTGSLLIVALTWVIDRYGMGNGVSLLIVAGMLPGALKTVAAPFLTWDARRLPPALVRMLVLSGLIIATTRWLLARSNRPQRHDSPDAALWLRQPTCGIVPIHCAGFVLTIPALLRSWRLSTEVPDWWTSDSTVYLAMLGILVVAFAGLCSWLFNRPDDVADTWSRVAANAPVTRQAAIATLKRMAALSTLWLLFLVGISHQSPDGFAPLSLVVATAVVIPPLRMRSVRRPALTRARCSGSSQERPGSSGGESTRVAVGSGSRESGEWTRFRAAKARGDGRLRRVARAQA